MTNLPQWEATAREYLERQEAATRGPWIIADSEIWTIRQSEPPYLSICDVGDEFDDSTHADGELIVTARNSTIASDLLAACERIRELEAVLDKHFAGKYSCAECGDTDSDLTTCAGCGEQFCDDCIEWCRDEYDEPRGDYFCEECQ